MLCVCVPAQSVQQGLRAHAALSADPGFLGPATCWCLLQVSYWGGIGFTRHYWIIPGNSVCVGSARRVRQ